MIVVYGALAACAQPTHLLQEKQVICASSRHESSISSIDSCQAFPHPSLLAGREKREA